MQVYPRCCNKFSFHNSLLHLFTYLLDSVCMHTLLHTCSEYVWRSDNKLKESLLLFYHVDHGNWTQVIRLGGNCLCTLSHLTGLRDVQRWGQAQPLSSSPSGHIAKQISKLSLNHGGRKGFGKDRIPISVALGLFRHQSLSVTGF